MISKKIKTEYKFSENAFFMTHIISADSVEKFPMLEDVMKIPRPLKLQIHMILNPCDLDEIHSLVSEIR